ncbi:low-density lipoprotein receptor-related protein 4-like [Acanthaster planci]|uniref:Low-density lipoprotein receptor-related protein 4-like n=1 Tax=Acanthaster planci TaxID=133434 RepID=A0A8B7XLY2_ACAPL|nr:low-density lipoprotein receptor-related protein 4-like [Acanthaster planci]
MKTFLRHGHILRILLTITAMVSIKQADAGDFMLVVSSQNNTIYAGSMAKQLADLYSLPLKGVIGPEAVDYDATEKMVYWTQYDGTVGKLSRAHLNGSNQMTVLDDRIRHAFGLALDVEAGLVYWTDESLGQVGRVRMDGTGTKETIIENLDRPRGIAIDHSRGYIYWTDVGNNPRIERANLDGTNRTTLIDDNLVWPKAVIIEGSNLFWCDGYLDKIERTNLSGSNRSILINLARYKPVHPHDLAIYKDYLYWSDQVKEGVVRVHLNGRGEQRFGQQLIKGIRRIHIQLEPDFCEKTLLVSVEGPARML